MFKNQPKGLYVLALANTGERFGYYTMLAILLLTLQAKFGFSIGTTGFIYSSFLALVYFMPMVGGIIADKWNFQKTVTLGIVVMFLGYLVMALPTHRGDALALPVLIAGLVLISVGTGLFKGNLQVMVGDLYNDPKYANKREMAFSLFYMAINIGAMFAPSVTEFLCTKALAAKGLVYNPAIPSICNKILAGEPLNEKAQATIDAFTNHTADLQGYAANYMNTITTGYGWAFAVACGSMVLSFLIYMLGRRTYNGVSDKPKDAKASAAGTVAKVPELTPQQTKSRITALLLVFAVIIFFWMVFHQNGATLTKFAEVFTANETSSWTRIGFNVWALATIAVGVYAAFNIFQGRGKTRVISSLILAGCCVLIGCFYGFWVPGTVSDVQPQIYQQFNPFYVVSLTPFSLAIFGWLAKRKKEPSAPFKIGLGMVVAAVAFCVMAICSIGLGVAPSEGQGEHLVSPNVLISVYLILTFAELLLSPMGIAFVSKVAPPKYKGIMMGCWFGATAIGNYLVIVPTLLWDTVNVALIWCILAVICLIAATFIFSILRKLEAATSDEPAPAPVEDALENVEDDAI